MKWKLSFGLSALLLLLLSLGCSESPRDKWVDHLEEVVSILEQHQDNPAEAAAEIRKYTEAHKAELDAVRNSMEKARETLSPEERERFAKKLVERLAPVTKRYMKLIARPELAGSQEILDAMAPYGP